MDNGGLQSVLVKRGADSMSELETVLHTVKTIVAGAIIINGLIGGFLAYKFLTRRGGI